MRADDHRDQAQHTVIPTVKIDPTGPVPPYRQIAEIIRSRIESGEYPQGSRIPTESEMVETWEVARTTARRAIALLRDQGLVETVPQRGTYVR
jgi:GntR family transcriptional regulator